MRVRLPVGRTLFFLGVFIFAMVALLPLRLAIDWFGIEGRGLAAREVTGSVWLGALGEAQIGGVPLGNLQARVETLPLFLGRARVALERHGAGAPFRGAATVSGNDFGFDDVTARLPVGAVFAPLPIASLDLREVSARFSGGQCVEAEGLVHAALAGDLGGLLLPGGLSGNVQCDGAALLLPLTSQSGLESVQLRLFPDGRYRADLLVRSTDDAVRDRLRAAGFAQADGGYRLRSEGRF